ncbi:hypothetical protein [Streptomyces hokutonensis]|uniref:hypothetical protein n=1 Tax=Streptomyces hokutonensis TaxID=1306990 RepID=UPI0033CB351D
MARPHTPRRPAPMDYRGLVLIVASVGLSIFGFQQSYLWGWHSAATWLCIVVGLLLLVVFVLVGGRTTHPLLDVDLFRDRAFLVQNIVLGVAMAAFVPVFFFTPGDRAERKPHRVVHRARGRGNGADAGTVQHRRGQPGAPTLLRRGDRRHADRAQLRLRPGPGLLGMGVIMAAAFVVALFGLRRGVQQELPTGKRELRAAQTPGTGTGKGD